jgi:hypothetical protein
VLDIESERILGCAALLRLLIQLRDLRFDAWPRPIEPRDHPLNAVSAHVISLMYISLRFVRPLRLDISVNGPKWLLWHLFLVGLDSKVVTVRFEAFTQ